MYSRTANFSTCDCLTRPDFYFGNENGKYCIYTNGFTYHNKSEDKVSKDRNIDNKLQKFGFQVMRHTGKDIRENLEKVVQEIEEVVR